MTKLSTISGHNIWLECHCGHHKSIAVSELLERLPDTTTVEQVQAAAKCLGCGERGQVKHMRITFSHGI